MSRDTPTFTIKKRGGGVSGRMAIDFAAELNEQQLAAVTAPPGPSLVVAGAGSGKTRTLTYRVAYLVQQGMHPSNILLLTFTNKAAREMLDRVASFVGGDVRRVWGGTFHSVGNRMLQHHAERVGYRPGFSILDSEDAQSLLKQVIRESGVDTKSTGFPKPSVIGGIFSMAANTARTIEETIEGRYPHFLEHCSVLLQFYEEYVRRKRASNAMDFDDLLVRSVELLREHPEAADAYRQMFHAVLVDEYQDTNTVQAAFVDLLAEGRRNLMVVGDDAQSIYSWRGADVRNILEFTRNYPDARLYRIETNYRSLPPILDLANAAISRSAARLEKTLVPARRGFDILPQLAKLADSAEQAEFVVQRIAELHESGVALSDIAVLYRAHYHSMELQIEMTRSKIPFRITSGPRFFDQAHVKDVTAFVKFAVNPRDEVSFRRCVLLLPGVGERSADRLWQAACKALGQPESAAGFQALLGIDGCPPKARKAYEQLVHTWCELAPGGQPVDPAQMIEAVVEAVYRDIAHASFTNADNRLADITKLADFAAQYNDPAVFLAEVALLSTLDEEEPGAEGRAKKTDGPPDAVNLSTVHQAKGLEWKVVFLIGLAEGMFPSAWALKEPDAIEEERRLFYVATTRAMDQLILTWPMVGSSSRAGYGTDAFNRPSRFLRDLPEHLLEKIQIDYEWG